MKKVFDKQKSAEALTELALGAKNLGIKAAEGAKAGVIALAEKNKNDALARRIKKYNPLFPSEYLEMKDRLPNIIRIVDDAVRRGIDVCEGSIGWLSKESGIEVLNLYDEAVDFSGLTFIPTASCDSVYSVDNFDRSRFIRIDQIFSKAHEERLAELEGIAYAVGAKYCSIEITESDRNVKKQAAKVTAEAANIKESAEYSQSSSGKNMRKGIIETHFANRTEVFRPQLKWFKHNDYINQMIDMCCENRRVVQDKMIKIEGSSCATLAVKAAANIDAVAGGAKSESSMQSQAEKEQHSLLMFYVEF